MDRLIVKGARNHNLKNIDIDLPKNKLIVFTGVSGSGKSTLAFDTIYAEGQRRYVESLSSYARQFLGIMPKPDVDSIEGLSPAISIDQKTASHNPRSTVGTVTEIYDYLRLLFARIGHPHCTKCGREIAPQDKEQIVQIIFSHLTSLSKKSGQKSIRALLLSPIVRDRRGEFSELLDNLKSKGYRHVRIDGKIINLDEEILLIKTNRHTLDAIVDRISLSHTTLKDDVAKSNVISRLRETVEHALDLSDGLVMLSEVHDPGFEFPERPEKMEDHLFSEKLTCPNCNISLPEIEPRLFSFNSPHGACPECKGLGSIMKMNANLVINPNLSITEGGILPFAKQLSNDTWYTRLVKVVAVKHGINPKAPLSQITEEQKKVLLYGTGKKSYRVEGTNRFGAQTHILETFSGVIPELERKFQESISDFMKFEMEKYMRSEICKLCNGTRLKKEAQTVTIADKSIVDVNTISVRDALSFITSLETTVPLSKREKIIAAPIIKEVKKRFEFLVSVGLDYLTVGRDATTLAGGEGQRIRLASQIGSGLSGVLYVLDEPSIGLHPRDNDRLIATLHALRDLDNTVLVVEHDREMIESADYIVDFGPGGGKKGGSIVAHGTIDQIKNNAFSLTGKYISGRKQIKNDTIIEKHPLWGKNIVLKGSSQFNLKNVDVSFPLGKFICITGVSGSGKSTLIVETLYKAMKLELNPYTKDLPGTYRSLTGLENIKYVYMIDQSPIGKTPRSNPATYVGAFNYIRTLFASLKESKLRGFGPGRFSFNVKGGRCENCEGQGEEKIEMQFLPPVWVQCEICNGKRYNKATLEVTFKGKNIGEILEMTVSESCDFFANIPGLYNKLQTLNDVGLDYIQLGQPAPTLSGGEAQRVKLSSELSKKSTVGNVYILDEPTTGLHFADLEKLLAVLKSLVAAGNTVIVIEHNLEMIKNADYIIDLGPEGGELGGEIIAQGTPLEIAGCKNSYTGQFLEKMMDHSQ
jgi:excinuclease ABC subunit A